MPYVSAPDDTRLFYLDAGTGPALVFVASAWLNSQMWELQIPMLTGQGFRCVAYDRRGHGRSDWPSSGYDYDTLADDLASLLNRLQLRDCVLVSHSAGAGEIVRYLTRHGNDRVAGIALVSGTTPFPMKTLDNPEGIDRALVEADMAGRTRDRAKWFAVNADGFFGIGLPGIAVSPDYAQYMMRQCLSCAFQATAAFFLTGFSTDLRDELRRVTVPTLIVHGDHDRQAPLDLCGRRTAALVPDGTLLVYENAAHGLFVTHADRLNADLAGFARSARSASSNTAALQQR